MRSLIRFSLHGYLVLAFAAGVPAAPGLSVLCVSPDGHVAIEVGAVRCADRAPAAGVGGFEGAASVLAPVDCGGCTDIPLGIPVLSRARNHGTTGSPDALVPALALATRAIVEPSAAELFAASAPAVPNPPASRSSKTTILRN